MLAEPKESGSVLHRLLIRSPPNWVEIQGAEDVQVYRIGDLLADGTADAVVNIVAAQVDYSDDKSVALAEIRAGGILAVGRQQRRDTRYEFDSSTAVSIGGMDGWLFKSRVNQKPPWVAYQWNLLHDGDTLVSVAFFCKAADLDRLLPEVQQAIESIDLK